jgi:hypothetical protein
MSHGRSSDSQDLRAEPIVGYEWARLGVGTDSIVLLLPATGAGALPKQDLEHITIHPNAHYRVFIGEEARSEDISVIATKGLDAWLVTTFLELTAMLLQASQSASPQSVQQFIRDLVSLFRALTQPSTRTLQGLWGELFLIHQSADVDLLARAWHATPKDRHDFVLGRERLEAKTTTGPRIHTFGHLQLAPVVGLRVTVASMVLLPSTDGTSCGELTALITQRIKDLELRDGFVKQVVRSVGDQWQGQAGVRFDLNHASNALRFFDIVEIPKITGAIPAEVSAVSYQSDVQMTIELAPSLLDPADRLTRAAMNA